jgi:hypothetical protein
LIFDIKIKKKIIYLLITMIERKIYLLEQQQIKTAESIKQIMLQVVALNDIINKKKLANENHKQQILDTINSIERKLLSMNNNLQNT